VPDEKPTSSSAEFAPADPTDGRGRYDWRTRYDDESAQGGIRLEAIYLVVLLLVVAVGIVALWLATRDDLWFLDKREGLKVRRFAFAWLAGELGGILFAMKWLYHSVARGLWNQDRRLWRLFTPHLSGGLAFAFYALISSELLSIFSRSGVDSGTSVLAISFLVGYFSDSATAKMTEVARTIFGTEERHGGRPGEPRTR
jgi:hypothetical protein